MLRLPGNRGVGAWPAMPEVHHTQARAQTVYQAWEEAEQGAGAATELFHLRLALLTAVELSEAGRGCIHASFQGTSDCVSIVSITQGYAGVNSGQALCSAQERA